MSELRNIQMCYLCCKHCDIFILYEPDSDALQAKNGFCCVCGGINEFTRPWKTGYVSESERRNQWASIRPLNSPQVKPEHADVGPGKAT